MEIVPLEEKEEELKNELYEIETLENGERFLSKLRAIDRNGNKFLSKIPNPIFVLLNSSIENYNKSEYYIEQFIHYSEKVGEKTYRMHNNQSHTSDFYNFYIECKITSINSLINSLEIFLNQKIPQDYLYVKEIENKKITFNKRKIENGLPFVEKIEKLLPEIFPEMNILNCKIDIENIIKAYSIRRETIHMKTNGKSIFEQYYEVMNKIIDSDLESFIKSSIKYMNLIEKDLIEFEN